MPIPRLTATSITIMAPDQPALAAFYARLLGEQVTAQEPGWAQLRTGLMTINIELEQQWSPPVWPAEPDRQRSTQHLDIRVDDLDAAETWAVECGATRAGVQPQTDVRVLLDLAGHPFCLFR